MLGVFLLGNFLLKLPVSLSMAAGAIAGALVGGEGIPLRHLFEGTFVYMDTVLIISMAMIFMTVIQKSGALEALNAVIVSRFHKVPAVMLILLMLIIMFPGMITGSSTAAVLSAGAIVAPILLMMGIPAPQTGAILAVGAIMGMAAPPVNIPAMLIAGGVDMPYIGFEGPLAFMTFPCAIFTVLFVGLRYCRHLDYDKIKEGLNLEVGKQYGLKLYIPILVVIVLMVGSRALPNVFPSLGMPLIFFIGSVVGLFTGKKFNAIQAVSEAVETTVPVLGKLMGVGMFIQVMTLTGVRGYIVVSCFGFGLIVPLTLEFIRCTLKEECRNLRLLQQVQMLLLTANILGWLLRGWAMFWLLPLMHLTILASIPLTLRDLFAAYKKTRSEDVRDILVGFGALAVCAAAALVFFYGDHAGWQYAVFYCVGLLCFLLQLGRIVLHRIRQASDEQAQLENYKKLAYADSLTGLFNYTAFKYMKSRWPERTDWTYIVIDVNWLKQTNDQYGHRAGDELLCCAARCIREAFYRAEDCFRIGGDEFAVIAAATDEEAVKAAVETLRRLCAEWDAKEEYPVSIAVGYAMQAGRTMTADELFMEADAAMYRNKAEIKKAVGGISR